MEFLQLFVLDPLTNTGIREIYIEELIHTDDQCVEDKCQSRLWHSYPSSKGSSTIFSRAFFKCLLKKKSLFQFVATKFGDYLILSIVLQDGSFKKHYLPWFLFMVYSKNGSGF